MTTTATTKRPERVYHYRGSIERGTGGKRRPLGYEWKDGYSETTELGILYPWQTRAECRREAKTTGMKAVFYRDGKRER